MMMEEEEERADQVTRLAKDLRNEKRQVQSELEWLRRLHDKKERAKLELAQATYSSAYRRTWHASSSASKCCSKRDAHKSDWGFVEAHKVLRYQDALHLARIAKEVRDDSAAAALWLAQAEAEGPHALECAVRALCAGVYGPDLPLLCRFINFVVARKLSVCRHPRRLLLKEDGLFSHLYSHLVDGFRPNRSFLAASLRAPVLPLLQIEARLSIDPKSADEDYRAKTVQALSTLAHKFIQSIRESWPCFPPTIAQIVRQTAKSLQNNPQASPEDVHIACSTLIFGDFICRAIVDPESFGVVDVPISNVNRFNLGQVALILQTLCLTKYREIDSKYFDLYSRFDKDCVYSMIDTLLGDPGYLDSDSEDESAQESDSEDVLDAEPRLVSDVVLLARSDAKSLITLMKKIPPIGSNSTEDSVDFPAFQAAENGSDIACGVSRNENHSETKETKTVSAKEISRLLKGVSSERISRLRDSIERLPDVDFEAASGFVLIIKLPSRRSYEPIGLLDESKVLERYYSNISRDRSTTDDAPESDAGASRVCQLNGSVHPERENATAVDSSSHGGQEKRTRFSLSHDEGSIGNTSDNLEAASEAASNHSVTSSLEIETEDQNDNLSDMISANVSGRGSPNISGRDTPSSQVTEGDPAPSHPQVFRQPSAPCGISTNANKQAKRLKKARHDIEDKFCKFEIKKLMEGDETFSILSDTWSTDVLASDTEAAGDSNYERNFITPIISLTQQCVIAEAAEHAMPSLMTPTQPDVFETASESAWSTDALVSDSDRMTEVDLDECNSVTRSEADLGATNQFPAAPQAALADSVALNVNNEEAAAASVAVVPNQIKNEQVECAAAAVEAEAASEATAATTSKEPQKPTPMPNGSATSRWLNDPCQKFPDQSSLQDDPKFNDYDLEMYFSSGGDRREAGDAGTQRNPKKVRSNGQSSFLDNLGKMASDYTNFKGKNKNSDSRSKSETFNNVASSGSAASLSNLSVNSADTSASDKSSSQEINSENVTELRVTPPLDNGLSNKMEVNASSNVSKMGSSTGAIPKSISFDATAEKNHRHSGRRFTDDSGDMIGINFGDLKNNMKRSGGNLLNKIKLFRNKSRPHGATEASFSKRDDNSIDDCKRVDLNLQIDRNISNELSDDILAKYRRKASSSSDAANSDSTSNSGSAKGKNREIVQNYKDLNTSDADSAHNGNDDANFEMLRRELRAVLSNMDIRGIELAPGRSASAALICALRLEGFSGGTGASRALGALAGFNATRGPALLKALRADYEARRPYAEYLARCRRSLLATVAAFESECLWQTNEIRRQGALAVAARARNSLDSREPRLIALQERLRSGLADERRDALFAALKSLSNEIANEDAWTGASEWELEQANLTIERVVMSRVYRQAMFPNGDGDIMRDQLLRNHMNKLANVVEPPIPRLRGVALLPAERILGCLSVYKTPRDKVQCIVRFIRSVMNLLSASSSGVPGADDLTPLLVYILIKVNPPSLLSTVQFVNVFAEPPLEGEQLYCWTQFCATVEYIKTMD